MEEVLLRFPHIGDKTFKKLRNKDLIKCKTVGRSWFNYINNDKFYKERVKYENLQKDVDGRGDTPLHKAAKTGVLKKCKLIIDNVENKNPADRGGRTTPLHYAAMKGHFKICKLIIERVEEKILQMILERHHFTLLPGRVM